MRTSCQRAHRSRPASPKRPNRRSRGKSPSLAGRPWPTLPPHAGRVARQCARRRPPHKDSAGVPACLPRNADRGHSAPSTPSPGRTCTGDGESGCTRRAAWRGGRVRSISLSCMDWAGVAVGVVTAAAVGIGVGVRRQLVGWVQRRVHSPQHIAEQALAIVDKGPHFYRYDIVEPDGNEMASLETHWWATGLLLDRPVQLVRCELRVRSNSGAKGSILLQEWLDNRRLGAFPPAVMTVRSTSWFTSCFRGSQNTATLPSRER